MILACLLIDWQTVRWFDMEEFQEEWHHIVECREFDLFEILFSDL